MRERYRRKRERKRGGRKNGKLGSQRFRERVGLIQTETEE